VTSEAVQRMTPIKDPWAYVASHPAAWNVGNDLTAFDSDSYKKRQNKKGEDKQQFSRPVPIRYEEPRVCGTEQEVSALNALVATGVDLSEEGTAPDVSPFPVGNISDLPTLMGWLDDYFPQWRREGQQAQQPHTDSGSLDQLRRGVG